MPKPSTQNKKANFSTLMKMFINAKYNVNKNPLIYANNQLLLAFNDSTENLWIAGANMSSTDLEHIINDIKNIINETLEDLPINVNAILLQPTDKPSQTKQVSYTQSQKIITTNTTDSYILIFNTIQSASEYLSAHPNIEQNDPELIHETSSYYETITKYINKLWTYTSLSHLNKTQFESKENKDDSLKAGINRLNTIAKKYNICGGGLGEPGKINIPNEIEQIVAIELEGSEIEKKWVESTQNFLKAYYDNPKKFSFSKYWKKVTK